MAWLTPDEHQEEVEAARDIVLRRLDRSPAPRAALAGLLQRRQIDPRIAQEILDRLESAGLIDDDAYAAALARTRFAEKGAARRAIAEELRLKGLGRAPSRRPWGRSGARTSRRPLSLWRARRSRRPGGSNPRSAGAGPWRCSDARATPTRWRCKPSSGRWRVRTDGTRPVGTRIGTLEA